MTSFAELPLAILLLAGTGAVADESVPSDAARGVPAVLSARVADAIAERWKANASDLRLEWSAVPEEDLEATAPFRLGGSGADGRFVVVLATEGGRPCAIRVRAAAPDTVTIATRAIASGTRLGADDVAIEVRTAWGPPRVGLGRPGVGWEARRALAAGEPLRSPSVAPMPVIASGDPVRLVWNRGGVTVSLAGTALQSAGTGEKLRARVEGRSVRLVAVATGPGTATLTEEGGR